MEFRFDGTHSGIYEPSQNLGTRLKKEFSDNDRWEFEYIGNVYRNDIGSYYGKQFKLIGRPSRNVANFLRKKAKECRHNHGRLINVRKYKGKSLPADSKQSWMRGKHYNCGLRNRGTSSKKIDDPEFLAGFVDNHGEGIITLRHAILSFKGVNQGDPDCLTSQRLKLTLSVPFMSKKLGFPYIPPKTQAHNNHHAGGGGPIRFMFSILCTVSTDNGVYNIEVLHDDGKGYDHKLEQLNAVYYLN